MKVEEFFLVGGDDERAGDEKDLHFLFDLLFRLETFTKLNLTNGNLLSPPSLIIQFPTSFPGSILLSVLNIGIK